MKVRYLLIFALLPLSLFSQSIRGTVMSAEDQAPLQAVHILNLSSGSGTTSLAGGSFFLSASPGDTLLFSAVGFMSYRHAIEDDESKLLITLIPEIKMLPGLSIYAEADNANQSGRRKILSVPGLRSLESTQRFAPMTFVWEKRESGFPLPLISAGGVLYGPFSYFSKSEKELRKMNEEAKEEDKLGGYLQTIHHHKTRQFLMAHHQLEEQEYDSLIFIFNQERLPLVKGKDPDAVLGFLMVFFAERCQ